MIKSHIAYSPLLSGRIDVTVSRRYSERL